MCRQSVPHHRQLSGNMMQQVLQKAHDGGSIESALLHRRVQLPFWRNRTDHRQMLPVRISQYRCFPSRRIRPHGRGRQIEARFVYENECALLADGFFSSSGHVSSCQRAISSSSRWLARSTGFWRLLPILLNTRPTCSMLYVTPNSRLITAWTRAQVHTSPRNPYASGPCASNSGKRWSCPSESRGFGPPPFRLRSAASPPSLTAVNHWLTAPDVTPSASAIRAWLHPFCFNSQARNRRPRANH